MSPIVVRDVSGEEISTLGAFLLQEKRTYVVHAPGALGMRLGGRVLEKTGDSWSLPVEFWAGRTVLRVEYEGGPEEHPVRVLPDPLKVSEGAWESILASLEELLPGLILGAQGGEAGAVGTRGVSLSLLTQALLPLVPSLLKSLRTIIADPRVHTVEVRDEAPLYRAQRVEREVITWLARHQGTTAELDILRDGGRSSAMVPRREARDSLEHPANCYVAWLTARVSRSLRDCALRWASRPTSDEEERTWCVARSADCRRAAELVDALVQNCFLRDVPRKPASDAALLVAIDDPRYARFQRQARRFLNPLFDPNSEDSPGAPLRPTFDIYELWCFLTIAKAIKEHWSEVDVRAVGIGQLMAGTGAGAKFAFQFPTGRQVDMEFNPTFSSSWTRGPNTRRFSMSGQRRPDIVLSATGGEFRPSWVPLDAKYRVSRGAACFARSRSPISEHRDHPFRCIAITHFGVLDRPFRSMAIT